MKRALERSSHGEAHAIIVRLRSYDDKSISINTLQILPKDGKSITEHWSLTRDRVISEVATDIREAVEKCLFQKLMEEGDKYSATKKNQAALKIYEQVLQLNPNDAAVYSKKGHIHLELKDYQQALIAFNQALTLNPNPNNAWAYRNKGYALSELKRYKEALTALEQAIHLDPNNAWAYERKRYVLNNLRHTYS